MVPSFIGRKAGGHRLFKDFNRPQYSVAILLMFILAIAIALAGYLYTTFYSSLQYTYVALTQAYIYLTSAGGRGEDMLHDWGSGGLSISGVELDGKLSPSVRVYVRGVERRGEGRRVGSMGVL